MLTQNVTHFDDYPCSGAFHRCHSSLFTFVFALRTRFSKGSFTITAGQVFLTWVNLHEQVAQADSNVLCHPQGFSLSAYEKIRKREECENREQKRKALKEWPASTEHCQALFENKRIKLKRRRIERKGVDMVVAGTRQSRFLKRIDHMLSEEDHNRHKHDRLKTHGLKMRPACNYELSANLHTIRICRYLKRFFLFVNIEIKDDDIGAMS